VSHAGSRPMVIGARRSPLAVAQARWVADQLVSRGHPAELVGIDSQGDVDRRHLTEIGGTGVFAAAVRDNLRTGMIDVAVHSLKDLPVAAADGLRTVATPEREDPRDVLVGLAVDDWRDGVRIGTGSPRRAMQLELLAVERGVQLTVVPIRGNVDTRLSLVRTGQLDGTVLAAAGLRRLGRWAPDEGHAGSVSDLPATALGTDMMLPAAGQGALAVECLDQADASLLAALTTLDDERTRAEVTCERTFLATLEAGCLAPVGCLASSLRDDLDLDVIVDARLVGQHALLGENSAIGTAHGVHRRRGSARLDSGADLGRRLAKDILREFGKEC